MTAADRRHADASESGSDSQAMNDAADDAAADATATGQAALPADLLLVLAQARDTILAAQSRVQAGEPAAIEHLPGLLGGLCQETAALAPALHPAIRPLLAELIAGLDGLRDEILARKQALALLRAGLNPETF